MKKKRENRSSTQQRRRRRRGVLTKPAAEGTGIPYDIKPSQSPVKTTLPNVKTCPYQNHEKFNNKTVPSGVSISKFLLHGSVAESSVAANKIPYNFDRGSVAAWLQRLFFLIILNTGVSKNKSISCQSLEFINTN